MQQTTPDRIGALGHWGWGNNGDTIGNDILLIKLIDFNIGSEISKPCPSFLPCFLKIVCYCQN